MSVISGSIGAGLGYVGAKNAAEAQLQAARESIAAQERMYGQSRADIAPWREFGMTSLTRLDEILKKYDKQPFNYEQTPEYQWQLEQGEQAINRSAAARGGVLGGRNMKDLLRFSQGLASQDYGRALERYYYQKNQELNPYLSGAQLGQVSAGQSAGLSAQQGESVAGTLLGMGQAQAGAYIGGMQGFQNMLSNVGSAGNIVGGYSAYKALSELFSSGGGAQEVVGAIWA